MTASSLPCPCGRLAPQAGRKPPAPLAYVACCGRYVGHGGSAPDAESLMRSRYTAFVHGDADYLRATWHTSTRPNTLELEASTRWLGLEVRAYRSTGEHRAEVEFVARYRVAGRAVRLHERSRFVHEAGRWYYVDGDQYD